MGKNKRYFFSLFSLINYFCFVLGYFHAFQCQEKINYASNIRKGKKKTRNHCKK